MGLISKIEDKLSGSSKHEDQNKLQKDGYGQSGTGDNSSATGNQYGANDMYGANDRYDTNHDGKLSHKEKKAMKKDEFDTNHDGKLSHAEKKAMKQSDSGYPSQQTQQTQQYDTNHDGKLSHAEKKEMKQQQTQQYDTNHDGKLSHAEKKEMKQEMKHGGGGYPSQEAQQSLGAGTGIHQGYGGASSQMPGSFDNQVDKDGYGTQSVTDRFERSNLSESQPGHHSGESQRYDPFSSKGQQTAAAAGQPGVRDYGSGATGQQDQHHYGRDAALAGGAGAGAYELEKGHEGKHGHREGRHGENEGRGHGGRNDNIGMASSRDNDPSYGSATQENRDAIPTAGGQKLGGLGSSGSGRDYESGTQSSGQHHYGRDAALGAGAAGVGAHEMGKDRKHGHHSGNTDQYSSGTSNQYGSDPSSQQGQHHYGRDAALGAGAAGVGAHELGKDRTHGHHSGNTDQYGSGTSNQYGSDPSSQQGQHHYGRDAALAGGAGAGAYEMDKGHEGRSHGTHGTGQSGYDRSEYDPRVSSEGGRSSQTKEPGMASRIANKLKPGSSNNNNNNNDRYDESSEAPVGGQHNYDRPPTGTQLPLGAESGRHGHHGHHDGNNDGAYGSSGLNNSNEYPQGTSGSATSGLPGQHGGAAYEHGFNSAIEEKEAGYQAALAHLEAQKHGQA